MGLERKAQPLVSRVEEESDVAVQDTSSSNCARAGTQTRKGCQFWHKRRGLCPQPLQLLLVAALRVSCADDGSGTLNGGQQPPGGQIFSLTDYQHSNLAQLVQFTMRFGSSREPTPLFHSTQRAQSPTPKTLKNPNV